MLTKKQKIFYFLLCIILLIIGFIIGNTVTFKEEKEVNCNKICKENNTENEEKENTKIKKHLYYSENGRNIYLYGIDRVTVNKQSLTILNDVFKVVDNLTKEYKLLEEYDDGGSKLYQINEDNKVDEKVNMLICNTLDGNTDVYFGNTNMKFESDFCKTNNKETFTKTYHVLKVLDMNTDEAKYLILKQFQIPEVAIVQIQNYLLPEIKENDPCEFTFKYTDNLIKDGDINSIFDNTELLKVEKTDKLGLSQINDGILKEYLEKKQN